MPPKEWVNWSRVHRAKPTAWESPRSVGEVVDLLARARRAKQRVRAVGAGHSWSTIAVPEHVALDLEGMRAVLGIDAAARTIRVQAGIHLFELTEALDRVGLAVPILGSVSAQSIAGAISTGTHGSSFVHGNLASLVEAMTLVTPRGDVLVLGRGDPRLPAARVGLGALGVIVELVLRVAPAFVLIGEVEVMPIREVARRLPEIAGSTEFVKVWWLPGARGAHVFRYLRTPEAPADVRASRAIDEHVVNRYVFPAALAAGARWPAITPKINALVARSYLERPGIAVQSHHAFNVAMPPLHRETEYAFDLDAAALVLDELASIIERERIAVDFPVEVRFVREDDAWMSPAYGRPTVQIGAYMSEAPGRARLFQAFESLSQRHLGRPHWGKEMDVDASYVARVWARAGEFGALSRDLDPEGTLRNAFLDRVLG
ncbi:MAG: D-arabinono-1,4-lactone oxidase [Sandaracinus sp.]